MYKIKIYDKILCNYELYKEAFDLNETNNKPKFKFSYLIILLVLVLLLVLVFTNNGYKGQLLTTPGQDIEQLIAGEYKDSNGQMQKIKAFYHKDGVAYVLVENSKYENRFPDYADYHFYYEAGDGQISQIIQKLEAAGIPNRTSPDGINFWDILYPILYIGFGIFLIWSLFRMISNSNKGAMTFGKSNARAYTSNKVKFGDVAGSEEEKEELAELVEFLRAPKKFTALGARIPKGILLVGPPGTGKTLLARAVAGEANVPFITISGSDFVEMFVGVGASRVRDLFEQAKKNKPCIVFIDEIDAVGRQRGAGLGGGNDEREQTLNQLLVEMDGFEPNEGIIVLAATNRSDVLDPALMRPGRFDRQIYVNIPDVKGREGILKIHARNKPLDDGIDFKTLAKITVGFTGADIENMLNEAAILAARAGRPKIIMSDITEGINKVVMGPQKKSRLVTDKDRKLTAYHESGHAILGKKLKNCDEIQEVSIIPRGSAGGYTMQRPENDNSFRSYNYLMDEIAMCMGGRIAEEIIFKDITTGASSDINQATKIARAMIYNYGMSKNLGFISLDASQQVFIGRDYQTKNDFSEKLAAAADDEIRDILDYNYKRAKKILTDNIDLLHEMSALLLERETINKEEVDMLIEGKKAGEIAKLMEEREKERREKELKIKEENAEREKIENYKRKVKEGERLLASGIISQKEYDAIKKEYEEFEKTQQEKAVKAPEAAETVVVVEAGVTPKDKTEEKKAETKPKAKAESKETKVTKPRASAKKKEEIPVEKEEVKKLTAKLKARDKAEANDDNKGKKGE